MMPLIWLQPLALPGLFTTVFYFDPPCHPANPTKSPNDPISALPKELRTLIYKYLYIEAEVLIAGRDTHTSFRFQQSKSFLTAF